MSKLQRPTLVELKAQGNKMPQQYQRLIKAWPFAFLCIALLVTLTSANAARAYQQSDPDAKFKSEVTKHEKLLDEIKLSVESWANSAKDKSRKSGKADSLVEIQKQVERFNRYGALPDSTSLQMQGARLWKSFLSVQKVYNEATQDLSKAGKQPEADQLKDDFSKFFEKYDPLPQESLWTGRVTTRTSDTSVKPTEQSVKVVITQRDHDEFTFRAEHNDLRHWQFTYAQTAQVYKATKAELVKQPNPNLQKILGTREVIGSDFKFNGTVLELTIIRAERTGKTTFSYVLTRTPS